MTFHFGWPQALWCILALMGIGVEIGRHGQPKEGKHSFWAMLIATTVTAMILYFGGFFGGKPC